MEELVQFVKNKPEEQKYSLFILHFNKLLFEHFYHRVKVIVVMIDNVNKEFNENSRIVGYYKRQIKLK